MKLSKKEADESILRIENIYLILNNLSTFFSKEYCIKVKYEDVFDALYLNLIDLNKVNHPLDIWGLDITELEVKHLLKDYNFKYVKNKVLTDSAIIPKDLLMNFKVNVKSKGLIWTIHKYDADPFPSNPHAHLIGSDIKLDLSNGKCYKKRNCVYTIKRKHLIIIRKQIENTFTLPKLKI